MLYRNILCVATTSLFYFYLVIYALGVFVVVEDFSLNVCLVCIGFPVFPFVILLCHYFVCYVLLFFTFVLCNIFRC